MNIKMSPPKLLLLSTVFFWFAQYIYIPFQTPYLTAMGLAAPLVGMIVGSYGVAQMVLRLPVGVLADCQNRHKALIFAGGASTGIASIFRVVLDDAAGYLAGNIFSGIASAMWISFMVLYMSFHPPEKQQKATGQIVLANNAGMLIAFILGTLLYDIVGMQWICIMSVLGGAACAASALLLPSGSPMKQQPKVCSLLKVCMKKRLIIFAVLALAQQGVQMSTTMSFTTQIAKNLGADGIMVGLSSIIYMFSAVLFARFGSSDRCVRIGPAKWIPLIFATNALYCVFIPQSASVFLIFVLQILPGVSTGILATCTISEAMKDVPEKKKSTAMGFFQAVYALGMTTFPVVCGYIADHSSISTAYLVLAAVCMLAAIASIIYYKLERNLAYDK